jgi:hypothetical protein
MVNIDTSHPEHHHIRWSVVLSASTHPHSQFAWRPWGDVGLGRVRMRKIDRSDKAEELFEFIRTNFAHGTHMITEGDNNFATIAKTLKLTHKGTTCRQPVRCKLP